MNKIQNLCSNWFKRSRSTIRSFQSATQKNKRLINLNPASSTQIEIVMA